MKIPLSNARVRWLLSIPLTVGCCSLLSVSPAMAQPIPTFLDEQGGSALTGSNLGQSALAIQRTCGELASQGGPNLAGSPLELFLRCNELVATADTLANSPTGTFPRSLNYADGNELLAAFQQVNGEEVQASADMAQSASHEQISSIAARLGALRGATGASITSVAGGATAFMFGSGGGAAADGLGFGPWGWFVRGTYTDGDRDPSDATSFNGQEIGFDYTQYGLTLGIDYTNGASVWGFALSYTNYEIEMKSVGAPPGSQQNTVVDGGKTETDSYNGSFYFDHNNQNNVYFSALAGYGGQSFDMLRNFRYFSRNTSIPNVEDQTRIMTASPDGNSIGASIALGRIIERGRMIFDPRIGVTYDRITIDQFSEVDSGNQGTGPVAMQLAFDEQTIKSLRGNLGFQLSSNVNTSFGSVRPTFSADWYYEFENDPRVIRAKYGLEEEMAGTGNFTAGFDNCVSCFNLTSEAPDESYFVLGAGIAAAYQSGFQAFFMLESLLGHKNLSAYAATVGLRGQF